MRRVSEQLEYRKVSDLRPHPENSVIFGDLEDSEEAFKEIASSMRRVGFLPSRPIEIKADGTIVCGHLRFGAARKLKLETVPVIVYQFDSYHDEIRHLVVDNAARRQLTKMELAMAFRRMRETSKSEGGTKGKRGAPRGNKNATSGRNNSGGKPGIVSGPEARDEAARILGISTDAARALETVFTTPGVPKELKAAVNSGKIKPTPAAKAVRLELKRQGGTIESPVALVAVADAPAKLETPQPDPSNHAERMEVEAAKYRRAYRSLFEVYRQLDATVSALPLRRLLGPTEHHEYATILRDISLRAWREVEADLGDTSAGKQMALVAIDGGKK